MKVLHVAECYSGGVARAIEARVRVTPEHEHHLLWSGSEVPPHSLFHSTGTLPESTILRIVDVRRKVHAIGPDVLHAHSSWAGLYARALRLPVPVVYEPHCFKFDDPDIPMIQRKLLWGAEMILARRSEVLGTLSAHEEALAQSLGKKVRTVRIPNTPTVPRIGLQNWTGLATKVAMVGRIVPQKSPAFFVETVQELAALGSRPEPVWIGDGEPKYRGQLEEAGVRVTGWLDSESLREELSNAIYVHTAAYEGFPLSILDAAACGAPIVARRIPAFSGLRIPLGETPREIARMAAGMIRPGEARCAALLAGEELLEEYNEANLSKQLARLYSEATNQRARRMDAVVPSRTSGRED